MKVGVGKRLSTEEQLDYLASEQRQADGDHHKLEDPQPPVPQRAEQPRLQTRAQHSANDHGDDGSEDQVQLAPRAVEVPGDDRAEGHQLPVGEVDQAGGSVDERQAYGAHGDDQAEFQAVEHRLRRPLPERRAFGGITHREHHRSGGTLGHHHLDGGLEPFPQPDPIGQRALIERDPVGASAGHRH